ncbi:hypothetical protein RhiirB3_64457 [Rhizophagus irregularis]|nr:hypothetical protein RhiirB3_181240 [Rhizophagus irregularis]PKY30046.1 hypothetical protein RhiirB3_64457 [Rhizophagus irregularis]
MSLAMTRILVLMYIPFFIVVLWTRRMVSIKRHCENFLMNWRHALQQPHKKHLFLHLSRLCNFPV